MDAAADSSLSWAPNAVDFLSYPVSQLPLSFPPIKDSIHTSMSLSALALSLPSALSAIALSLPSASTVQRASDFVSIFAVTAMLIRMYVSHSRSVHSETPAAILLFNNDVGCFFGCFYAVDRCDTNVDSASGRVAVTST